MSAQVVKAETIRKGCFHLEDDRQRVETTGCSLLGSGFLRPLEPVASIVFVPIVLFADFIVF